ncbi:hypothetical protein [Streptomyces sp. NBRC 110611]|uniref:hypothetical protein n=1 Tax=Streptomyces sp. NBRC 110611 TaxID=1621259 RepID=UPI0011BEBA4B
MRRRSKEEVWYVAGQRHTTVQDHIALVEIDLTGELMIAAAAASEDRLSPARIDEVLAVVDRSGGGDERKGGGDRGDEDDDEDRGGGRGGPSGAPESG